jgi:hypothetical protein
VPTLGSLELGAVGPTSCGDSAGAAVGHPALHVETLGFTDLPPIFMAIRVGKMWENMEILSNMAQKSWKLMINP